MGAPRRQPGRFLSGIALALTFALAEWAVAAEPETLPPLRDGRAPDSFETLWAGFDPRREPMDVEVLKEWEEDAVVLRIVRYLIGVFKGQKAMRAAVFRFPKGGKNLPGLVQIHGGGQSADPRAVLTNAKRGYATVSLAWAGRISAPAYTVNHDGVALFWAGKTNDPTYKLTTDWGALDAYHAPCRNERNNFQTVAAAPWTLDAVESPRNNPWFLCALGARRALTFLEIQPEVDPKNLGVYGHSMGGKLTVLTTAADTRVQAAAPSCGVLSDRSRENPLYRATINDEQSLRRIRCPIVFLSPANDFRGRLVSWSGSARPTADASGSSPQALYPALYPRGTDLRQHTPGQRQFPAFKTLQRLLEGPAASLQPARPGSMRANPGSGRSSAYPWSS